MAHHYVARALACLLVGSTCALGAVAQPTSAFDALLAEHSQAYSKSSSDRDAILERLKALEPSFTPEQNEKYQLAIANSLGDQGKHVERVALVESFIGQVKAPAGRVSFLYELIQGNTALGRYENALQAMNESILLLPGLQKASQKVVALQGALNLLTSLRAYDEALDLAERMYALRGDAVGSYAACAGLANKVETNYMRGNSALARSLVPNAISACEAFKNQFLTLIVKTHAAIDLIDSGNLATGITTSLALLQEYAVLNKDSEYLTLLQEALARAYLATYNFDRAEQYGFQAYERAQKDHVLILQEKTSQTMAAIKRAQGQLSAAIDYYDINLTLKDKVLDDQLHKNLAYQRVKFDTRDKANQMALLEQKNKNLSTEKALQQNKYQNLILLMTLILVVLAILGAWLFNTLRLKNTFRLSAQIDGLTQVSNRAHFTASAQHAFKDMARNVSLVLFDMDLFKKINDTYGHAAGDWVLKTVCITVKAQLQKAELLGRLGGEEFAICLPNFPEMEAELFAERCRTAIAAIDTNPSGFAFSITASFGISTRSAGQSTSFEDTLVEADKALYLSKNEGRNRVTVYQRSIA
nr:GGDEF domain-containing protein [Rhodoferax sp.]